MAVRKILQLASLLLVSLAAHAQFLGYVSPQTVQVTLTGANPLACTGGVQNFTTGVTAGFLNLGQTQHQLTIVTSGGTPQIFQAAIFGIDNAGNAVQISDSMRLAQYQSNAGLFAHGYYPKIRVSVTCSTGTNFTASYAGSSSDSGPIIGAAQIGQLSKIIASQIPANAGFTDNTIQTPFGNAQGFLAVLVTGSSIPAGSSIALTCQGNQQTYTLETFTLPTSGTQYTYPVPPASCPFVSVTYTSGGASTGLFDIEYDFVQPGSGNQAAVYSPVQLGVNAITEPATGTSALSNIVDTRNAKEATLDFSCTAGAVTVNVQTYNDDGITTATLISPLSAVAAATKTQLYIGSDVNSGSSGGTISSTAVVRFPQRALAFSFTNAGGAGTCTARLYMNY